MATTEAQKRASLKYQKSLGRFSIGQSNDHDLTTKQMAVSCPAERL